METNCRRALITPVALAGAMLAMPAFAAETGTLYPEGTIDKQALERILPDKPPWSPHADRSFTTRPLFCDTPLRVYCSLDASATELIAVWKNPEQPAFYYGRVIEIPTPRWTAYDAKYFGLQLPPEIPMTTQERAYTSPIWYTPGKG